jgi:hypothetical protein
MSLIFYLLAAASAFQPAADLNANHLFNGRPATNPVGWVTPNDGRAQSFTPRGRVGFTITVSPSGKPQACKIFDASGDSKTDALTCDILMRRAEFEPAHDRSGSFVATQYSSAVSWSHDDRPITHPPVFELDLSVNRLPDGVTSPSAVFAEVVVDETGRALDCDAKGPSPQQLKTLACSSLMNSKLDPLVDENGKAEKSIIGAKVQINTAP